MKGEYTRYDGVLRGSDREVAVRQPVPHLVNSLCSSNGKFVRLDLPVAGEPKGQPQNRDLLLLVAELEQRVADLEAQNEALDAFAHSVAHDLKGSLAVVVSYAELIQTMNARLSLEEKQRCLERIEWNGLKLSRVVDELLWMATTRHGEVAKGPLDMAHIVGECTKRLAHMIEGQNAQLVLPDQWPTAVGYGPWTEEVWVNYMSNAIKYGGRPPRVELGAAREDSFVRFWVRDNGRGLAPEEQEVLFSPASRDRRVHHNGHGLGLSIVRRIVDRLGGQVRVESEIGQGSTFSFTLPAAARSVLSDCRLSGCLA